MANPMPAQSVTKFEGAGNFQVHTLVGGTALDPQQDGFDVAISLESSQPTSDNNAGNRVIEAFGRRFAINGNRIHERNKNGDGVWGIVFTLSPMSSNFNHTGLHLMYISGVATLAVVWHTSTGGVYMGTSVDGDNWVTTQVATVNGTIAARANSVVLGNAIYWYKTNAGGWAISHVDIATGTHTPIVIAGATTGNGFAHLHLHKNRVFLAQHNGTNEVRVYRLDGTVPTDITGALSHSNPSTGSGMTLYSDGEDIILITPGITPVVELVYRISDPLGAGSPSADLSAQVTVGVTGIAVAGTDRGWNKFVSITPNPLDETIYLWYNKGVRNAGTYDMYRVRWRQITHGAPTGGSFTAGQGYRVEQTGSGARGRIMESSGTTLDLTDVTGTFDDTNLLTEEDASGAATGVSASASGFLVEQFLVFEGVGIAATDYSIPNVGDGGSARIPTFGAARPQFDGNPVEVTGGIRRRFFRVYGTGADIDLRLFYSVAQEAPDTEATISAVAPTGIVNATTDLIGNLGEVALEALTPSAGDAYLVNAIDGDLSLTPGGIALVIGMIVEFDGANWTVAHTPTANPINPDLVAYYKLNGTGNRVDTSGSGFDLTEVGTVPAGTGLFSNGADIPGTSGNYLERATDVAFDLGVALASFSISVWVNADTLTAAAGYAAIVSHGTGSDGWQLGVGTNAQSGRVEFYKDGGLILSTGNGLITAGAGFQHIVVTSDGVTWRIYVDGVEAVNAPAASLSPSAAVFRVGHRQVDQTAGFDGVIDEVAIWKPRTITAAQVVTLYNGGVGQEIGSPDLGTHAILSSVTPLIAPYTDGADDGKQVVFDATTLAGIPLTTPAVVSNEIQGITPDNGATLYYVDHDASADLLIEGQKHTVALDIS